MTKEVYLLELRKRLSILDEFEVNNIINEYIENLNQRVNEGISEEEALNTLGNINDLAKNILSAYKISDKYVAFFIGKEKLIDDITDFTNKLADASNSVFNKVEESVIDITKTTGNAVKTAYKETIKFGEERINDVKNFFTKKDNEQETQNNQPHQ